MQSLPNYPEFHDYETALNELNWADAAHIDSAIHLLNRAEHHRQAKLTNTAPHSIEPISPSPSLRHHAPSSSGHRSSHRVPIALLVMTGSALLIRTAWLFTQRSHSPRH